MTAAAFFRRGSTAPTVHAYYGPELTFEDAYDGFRKVARNAPCPCGSGRKDTRSHRDPARRNA